MNILTRSTICTVIASACIALLTFGCASTKPPAAVTTQIISTDTSIAQAEQAGAAQGALPELQNAKDKRASAQQALVDKKYDVAMRFAQQAQVDAQFAAKKAQAIQGQKSADEVDRGTEKLRDETERNLANERERPPGTTH
jgi:hypothetical protein